MTSGSGPGWRCGNLVTLELVVTGGAEPGAHAGTLHRVQDDSGEANSVTK